MKITKQDVTINFAHYGKITVPKGTKITNKTALGNDENYNFVDEFNWIKTNYPNIERCLTHDAIYYGINIPKEYVTEK